MPFKMKHCLNKLLRRRHMPEKHLSREALIAPQHDGLDEEPSLTRIPSIVHKALDDELTYWGPTKRIPEAQLAALLQRTIPHASSFKLINRLNGAFNVAYILESDGGSKICVRVPACGFPARWNQ